MLLHPLMPPGGLSEGQGDVPPGPPLSLRESEWGLCTVVWFHSDDFGLFFFLDGTTKISMDGGTYRTSGTFVNWW